MRTLGVISRGIRAPIIKKGDNLVNIVVDSVLDAVKENKFELHEKDVVAVTEAVVARAQGNYATLDDIATDIKEKFPNGVVGLIFPILSRNRFSMILKGISRGVKKLYIMLSYPQDEVGNPLTNWDKIDELNIDTFNSCFSETEFRGLVGEVKHPFTGMDYIKYYKEVAECDVEVILSNNAKHILRYTKDVICADIHTRARTQRSLIKAGADKVIRLDEILTKSINGSGYQPDYGVLGSNLATDSSVKLFPRDAQKFAEDLQAKFIATTGKSIECMVYGDGAFKDPVGGIWELADPVVSPGFTKGLLGQPNELKLKYLADNKIADLSGEQAVAAMKKLISEKKSNLNATSDMSTQGTTPRQLTDLLGSLSDLTSGSGDKGTPIILIQGYFDNYSNN